jgi:hypothetical protein
MEHHQNNVVHRLNKRLGRHNEHVEYFFSNEFIYFLFFLAAKKRNPLTALQEDEPVASPAPSSVQMPFTPGRTPNKNRGFLRLHLFLYTQRNPLFRNGIFTNDIYNITCTK